MSWKIKIRLNTHSLWLFGMFPVCFRPQSCPIPVNAMHRYIIFVCVLVCLHWINGDDCGGDGDVVCCITKSKYPTSTKLCVVMSMCECVRAGGFIHRCGMATVGRVCSAILWIVQYAVWMLYDNIHNIYYSRWFICFCYDERWVDNIRARCSHSLFNRLLIDEKARWCCASTTTTIIVEHQIREYHSINVSFPLKKSCKIVYELILVHIVVSWYRG